VILMTLKSPIDSLQQVSPSNPKQQSKTLLL
jgi:hypothetical protein